MQGIHTKMKNAASNICIIVETITKEILSHHLNLNFDKKADQPRLKLLLLVSVGGKFN
jgi:hypothetical protein